MSGKEFNSNRKVIFKLAKAMHCIDDAMQFRTVAEAQVAELAKAKAIVAAVTHQIYENNTALLKAHHGDDYEQEKN